MARIPIKETNITAHPVGFKNEWSIKFSKRVDGKFVRNQSTLIGSHSQVEKQMKELKETWINRLNASKTDGTINLLTANLKELVDYYLKAIGRDSEEGFPSKKAYKTRMCFINSMLKSCGPIKVYQGDCKPYYSQFKMKLRPIFHNWKRVVGNTTIAMRVRLLKPVFEFLVRDDMISSNPMNNEVFQSVRRDPPRIARIVTIEDVQRLLNAVQEYRPHIFPVVLFSLHIPLRKSEVSNLSKEHMNLEKMRITIPKEKSKNSRVILKTIPENMREYFENIPPESNYIFYRKVGGTKRREN